MRFTVGVEQDIGGLQIAMKNPALMGVMDGAGNFGDKVCDRIQCPVFRMQSSAVCRATPLTQYRRLIAENSLCQRPAFDQLHAEIELTVVLADLVNGND